MTSTHPAITHQPAPATTPSALPVWPALLAGALPPAVLWTALVPVGGLDLVADSLGLTMRVGLGEVLLGGAVAALGALATARLLQQRAGRPRRVFTIVAGTVLLLSLLGPLVTAQTTEAVVGLVLLHLSVGLAVILVVAARLTPENALL